VLVLEPPKKGRVFIMDCLDIGYISIIVEIQENRTDGR
jgi:hypothetical protein